MTDSRSVEFIKFNAINEFMLEEYRLQVIQTVFDSFSRLSPEWQRRMVNGIKSYLSIPGFRNPNQAPLVLKMRHAVTAFQKNADFCALTLQIWSEANKELRAELAETLISKGWNVLPPEVDRTTLPGFLTSWPAGEDYDTVESAYKLKNPASNAPPDDIRLMAVWLSGRLPLKQNGPDAAQ